MNIVVQINMDLVSFLTVHTVVFFLLFSAPERYIIVKSEENVGAEGIDERNKIAVAR